MNRVNVVKESLECMNECMNLCLYQWLPSQDIFLHLTYSIPGLVSGSTSNLTVVKMNKGRHQGSKYLLYSDKYLLLWILSFHNQYQKETRPSVLCDSVIDKGLQRKDFYPPAEMSRKS